MELSTLQHLSKKKINTWPLTQNLYEVVVHTFVWGDCYIHKMTMSAMRLIRVCAGDASIASPMFDTQLKSSRYLKDKMRRSESEIASKQLKKHAHVEKIASFLLISLEFEQNVRRTEICAV